MSLVNANALFFAAGGDYQISRSVRLRSSATAYFNRTPAVASNRKTWTWSGWIKRGALSATQQMFGAGTAGTDINRFAFRFDSNDVIRIGEDTSGTFNSYRITTQVFRDPSAWYHFVLTVDTTQATANNRVRLYVNGSEVTAFSTTNNPSQNSDTFVNNNILHRMGYDMNNGPFDGYFAEINFIDGQALTPSSFGETNPVTGVWQPKKYVGTYGTNGFYLNFSDNSAATAAAIGKDSSGNGNNWTPNNISVTAGTTYDSMIDSPTAYADGSTGRGNYCVLNPLRYSTNGSLSSANLNYANGSGDNNAKAFATFGISSGKWYYEAAYVSGVSDSRVLWGFGTDATSVTSVSLPFEYSFNGQSANTMQIAIDYDAGKIWYGFNNTWVSSGNPSAGTNPYQTFTPSSYPILVPGVRIYGAADGTTTSAANFGQRPFTYTPPTGYKALNTLNLATPTITRGDAFFNVNTWTGDQSARTITNSGAMQPDFLWTKSRSNAEDHRLSDSVRGGNGTVLGTLASNTTGVEAFDTDVTGFTSTGFNIRAGTNSPNVTGRTYVGWQWQAGRGTNTSNTSGSITSTVSANTTAGFSVVSYTGTGSAATVGHGLGVAPRMIITKKRSGAQSWGVGHAGINSGSSPWNYYLELDLTNGQAASSAAWNNTAPTSSVFSVGTGGDFNSSGANYIAYCFAAVTGYSAFGSYTGNGSTDGPFVFTGFRPRWIMVKRTDSTGDWPIIDSARNGYNQTNPYLFANLSNAEYTTSPFYELDILSNGFKFRNTGTSGNASGGTYIYAAFAENPFRYALAR
jgi:hypothetical protein